MRLFRKAGTIESTKTWYPCPVCSLDKPSKRCLQRQFGELLAAACRGYAKAAQCKLHSVAVGAQHLRLLEYQAKDEKAVVAYVAHDVARGDSSSRLMLKLITRSK